jgi:N-methylhydantoinase A
MARLYAKLEREAVETLARDGIERSRMRLHREADVRYVGQSMEVRVPAPAGAIDASFVTGLIEAFHAAHKRTFGYNYAGQQRVELVNFCVSGFGLIERPEIPKLASDGGVIPVRKAARPVYFDGEFRETPVYDRAKLLPGVRLEGPTIVDEFGSTTVVFPGQFLEVDPHGVLIVRRISEARA